MKTMEQALQIYGTGNGAWVPVARLRKVRISNASKEDVIQLHFKDHDLPTPVDPVALKGSGVHQVNFPLGRVRVKRLKGTAPITVTAICERPGNGIEANARRGIRGSGDRGSE